MAVYRPATGLWIISGPTGVRTVQFGDPANGDIPVPGDYDGVGHAELAVFRAATAQWLIASPTGVRIVQFGGPSSPTSPIPGDYDGTGHTELAVFRPASATWIVNGPKGLRSFAFGEHNLIDIPVEAPVGSLTRIGTVGGIHLSSLTAPVPAAATAAGAVHPRLGRRRSRLQAPVLVSRKLAQTRVDGAIAGLYVNGFLWRRN